MSRDEVFDRNRPLLFSIAYRMTGSVMDAEDAVQGAYLGWQQASEDEVRSPSSYLSAVVTRLCIDRLRSARVRREQYVGPWLPEPLLGEQAKEIAGKAELEDSLSMALLVLLESLTPVERAVFLLREVFAYEYAEIASLVGKSEANCRQISRRARQSLAARRPLVVEGDRAYFRTWDTAWKLRRIRNNPEVEFTPSTAVAGLRCRR